MSNCAMEETDDLAALLVGTYKGKGSDSFSSSNGIQVIITRISNNEIEITPDGANIFNSTLRLKVVQDGNWIRHDQTQNGVTFEAKASKNNIPMSFSTNAPVQAFDGNRVN
ncbi:MAG: hypothetical protein JXQ87_09245 [Bacteroidia bacterium]